MYLYVQFHLEIGILKNKKIKNLQIGILGNLAKI